jgi:N-carbamoylputrescine amidase
MGRAKRKRRRSEGAETEADANELSVAVLQCALNEARELNLARVLGLVRDAAEQGATVILPPLLAEGPYFCRTVDDAYFEWARPVDEHPTLDRFRRLAGELEVVLAFSFFERAGPAYYASVAVIDADGKLLGTYRAAHLASGPDRAEKHYFRPGDSGFRVWTTQHGKIGVGASHDLWFPEAARAMSLLGAELLLYPVAFAAEETPDAPRRWQRATVGHAVSNAIPVAVANRVGEEGGLVFGGRSCVVDPGGTVVAELGPTQGGIAVHGFDRAALARGRAGGGLFRDRRPELYAPLLRGDDCG